MGTIKKVIDVIGEDALGVLISEKAKPLDMVKALSKVIVGSYEAVRDLVKQVFTGLTDQEFELLELKEIARVLLALAKHTASSIGVLAGNGDQKN